MSQAVLNTMKGVWAACRRYEAARKGTSMTTTIVLKRYAAPGDALRVVRAVSTLRERDSTEGAILVVHGKVSDLVRNTLRTQCPEGTLFAEREGP